MNNIEISKIRIVAFHRYIINYFKKKKEIFHYYYFYLFLIKIIAATIASIIIITIKIIGDSELDVLVVDDVTDEVTLVDGAV
jgi:hypothetical protein